MIKDKTILQETFQPLNMQFWEEIEYFFSSFICLYTWQIFIVDLIQTKYWEYDEQNYTATTPQSS